MLHTRRWRKAPWPVARRLSRGVASVYLPPVPTIVLNGEPTPIPEGESVAGLLAHLGLDPRQVAVERNREIVPRAEYPEATLAEGDHLEIVTFVGGG
ncbi:MAG: sulfur carrier protein ThiS [Myxococcales bacterium]|nr:sulfur carrier protein ThiS [Myxococcales bacterium]MCB9566372.1 sulfur carrier protein ThiS [Myxococcales bacterium]MCB9705770.1 sulfur carrier protein ThiS [Myxococcales bacterium]